MSFLWKARIFTSTCTFTVQASNFNKLTPNRIVNHITKKGLPSISQLRLHSTEDNYARTIYIGSFSANIKRVKLFSFTTSIVNFVMQGYLMPTILASNNVLALGGTLLLTACFGVGTPILLHLVTRKYVTKMTYDDTRDVYTASVYTFFASERQIEFTPEDVSKPAMRELLTTCYVHDTPLLFNFENFTDIDHYSRILGYDKPMDFQLEGEKDLKSVTAPRQKND
ncbi:transmembrane protein 70 homolog, mitochondrial [Diachasmimorpha longicaudata]|uniref:transmembrane protein 70 homolog, mitochondrial n=1 Tax=Diachasmimorpha longicaudata TaxID=58733 RepID=UPI0030B8BDB8